MSVDHRVISPERWFAIGMSVVLLGSTEQLRGQQTTLTAVDATGFERVDGWCPGFACGPAFDGCFDPAAVVRVAMDPVRGGSRRRRWIAATAVCGAAVGSLMFIEARPDGEGEGSSYLHRGWEAVSEWDLSTARDWVSGIPWIESGDEPSEER